MNIPAHLISHQGSLSTPETGRNQHRISICFSIHQCLRPCHHQPQIRAGHLETKTFLHGLNIINSYLRENNFCIHHRGSRFNLFLNTTVLTTARQLGNLNKILLRHITHPPYLIVPLTTRPGTHVSYARMPLPRLLC